jgi:hypothetical protein
MLRTLTRIAGAVFFAGAAVIAPTEASAHWVPAPCDFVTGGGFIWTDQQVDIVNFGAHGGCKNGKFWGHFNVVDHQEGLHFNSVEITGYLFDPDMPEARDICGWARVNTQAAPVRFRMRLGDFGEPGTFDVMGFAADFGENATGFHTRFYKVGWRMLNDGQGGGGNVQLHKGNPSNTAGAGFFSLSEGQMCPTLHTPNPN